MDKINKRKNNPERLEKYICGECGGKNIETTEEIYKFPYGIGSDAVELSCEVPVRHCKDCGFSFMDREAEDLSHEEVCRHLDVLTPAQIKALRELYQLTQAQFSKITKLGEATLSRWERGILVQNNAYDNYLYLLGFKENLKRICDRSEKGRDREQLAGTIGSFQFRELDVNEELLERQSNFELIKV